MKKIVFFVMIFVALICSVCFADGYTYEDFQNGHIPARWVWVSSNSKSSVYLDKQSVEYNPKSDEASTFELLNDTTKNEYSIYTVHINFSDKTIWVRDTCTVYKYGATDGKQYDIPYKNSRATKIIPGTFGEGMYNYLKKLCNREKARADYTQQQEQIAAKKAQDQADKEKRIKATRRKQQQEANTNAAIGILGGILGSRW
jgi:hypothetical protein